jgi:peptide deformylase
MNHTNPRGVGLSAPQLGKNWNLFVTWLNADPDKDATPQDLRVFINPKITNVSQQVTFGEDKDDPILEGCLSIPQLYGPVPRHEWIEIRYDTLENDDIRQKEERFESFMARVVQHEYDHLEGVLFTDYSLKYELPVYEHRGKSMVPINLNLIRRLA